MIIKHNFKKYKKLKFPNKTVERNLAMEIQLLESSENMLEYHNYPRGSAKRSHSLLGEYKNCFAVGLDARLRMIHEPIYLGNDPMAALETRIIEYMENYH